MQQLILTKKTVPWTLSMQRPAPGGKVRSEHADTETISGTSTLTARLSIFAPSPDLPERPWDTCFWSPMLIWWGRTENKKIKEQRSSKRETKKKKENQFALKENSILQIIFFA